MEKNNKPQIDLSLDDIDDEKREVAAGADISDVSPMEPNDI